MWWLTCGAVVFVNVPVRSSLYGRRRRIDVDACGGGGDCHRHEMSSVRWWVVRGNVEEVENVDTSYINSPDRHCHRPVTRQNGDGNITGDFFLTRPRPRGSRTRDPARVCIPVSITSADSDLYIGS